MDECKHETTWNVGAEIVCKDCFLVPKEGLWPRRRHEYADLSRCTPSSPLDKKLDNVLIGYMQSLPDEYQHKFLAEFRKNNKKGQPRKKKMVIAKYIVCCRYGLGFDLDEEVKKLGGGVRVSTKDLL